MTFRQELEPAYGWGTIFGRVRWVQSLPLPGSLAVEVQGGLPGATLVDWRCSGAGGSRSCTRVSDRPFAVIVPIAGRSEGLGLAVLAGIVLAIVVAATLVARRTARLHRALFGDVSDPRDVRAGYRDPAVIPDEAPPTMPAALGARLRRRALLAALGALVPIGAAAVVLDGRSETPMPSLLSLLAIIGGVSTLIFLSSAHGRWATLFTTLFAAAGIGLFGLPGAIAGLAPALADVMFRSTTGGDGAP